MSKERLDVLLCGAGLAESREQAQRLILAGQVLVNRRVESKPGHRFDPSSDLELKALPRFVGRGGEKLEAAFQAFGLDVQGRVCVDVGASTGGFTDCLLQHGAAVVFAVDVGRGQLHWKLRNDSRVVVMEGTNARTLSVGAFSPRPSCAVVDVSFISLTKVLPAVIHVLALPADIVTLVKPQFEAGREHVAKGGVVRDERVRRAVVEDVRRVGVEELGLVWRGVCPSPLRGPAGNVEFLACWRKQRTADRGD